MKNLLSAAAAVLAAMFLFLALPAGNAYAAPKAPNCNIVYQFVNGGTFTVTPGMAMSMMVTNPDGSYFIDPATNYYVLDPAKMAAFFSGLQALFPPALSPAAGFKTTRGDVLAINAGIQQAGYIDTNTEMAYLADAIMSQKKETHVPALSAGGTYIEIDITNQMLYYYVNGIKAVETPIVTGNVSAGHNTPTGVFHVGTKRTRTSLVGKGYVSFVNYWMPIVGNSIGIHDATWRSNFGGSIYRTAGSHGCINVPLAVMKDLYPMVEQGTTVVVFH